MKRVMLVVAYDGTNYCGWQVQPNAVTVEGVINQKLSELLKEDIKVIGASRTDSGVHALGNVAVFDTKARIPGEKVSYALNQRLPDDIRIQSSREVPSGFHPRYCKCWKEYEYHIFNSDFALPTERLYSYFVYRNLNLEDMKEAAGYLVGEHDFKSFCSTATQTETTVRNIYGIDIQKHGKMIIIKVRGNGFLYNMVRIIVGTLIQVGLGFYEAARVKEMLEAQDRTSAGPTAPACGLRLNEIFYDEEDLVGKNK